MRGSLQHAESPAASFSHNKSRYMRVSTGENTDTVMHTLSLFPRSHLYCIVERSISEVVKQKKDRLNRAIPRCQWARMRESARAFLARICFPWQRKHRGLIMTFPVRLHAGGRKGSLLSSISGRYSYHVRYQKVISNPSKQMIAVTVTGWFFFTYSYTSIRYVV